jgi:hypothetical protein
MQRTYICMYTCIYIYIYIYIHTYRHIHNILIQHTFRMRRTYICMHACTHTHIHTDIYTTYLHNVHTYFFGAKSISIFVYIHIHTCSIQTESKCSSLWQKRFERRRQGITGFRTALSLTRSRPGCYGNRRHCYSRGPPW